MKLINRSRERALEVAKQFAEEFHGAFSIEVFDWEALGKSLMVADLVISTTAATEPIMTLPSFQSLHQARKKKGPQLILDLAVPQDFETGIGQLPNVYLYSVDDLQQVCERNLNFRRQQWPTAKKIIYEETIKFLGDLRHRQTGPTIAALRDQAQQIKAAELERLRNRLTNHQVTDEAIEEIAQAFDRVINKVLHPPLQSLREEIASPNHASLLQALKRLFNLQ